MFANLFQRKPGLNGLFGQPETYEGMGGAGPQMPMPQGGGILGMGGNPNYALMMAGAGILGGKGNSDAMSRGMQGAATGQLMNERADDRQKSEAEEQAEIAALEGLGLEPGQLKMAQASPSYRAQLFKSQFDSAGGVAGGLGLNPQYGVDEQGNPVLLQLGKDGKAVQTGMPEGVRLAKEPIKLDAGTHFVMLDPITRQPVGTIPKDLAGAESQKAQGEAQGKAIGGAPGDIQSGENALQLLDSIRNDPNRKRATGKSSVFNLPGTQGYDFQQKVEQAKSGAFLTAIQQMRGLGQLSNAEGATATAAVTRMNTALTEEGFMEALSDYERIVKQGISRAQQRLGQQPQQGGANTTSTGVQWRVEE